MTAKILLVDDDPVTIQLLSRILSGLGEIRIATNGIDALDVARSVMPDVILLDGEMPGMSGLEVMAELKADPTLTGIPTIFVTAHREEAFEVAGLAVGAADFIGKPVSPPLVVARVKAQLRFKAMADQLRQSAVTDALTGLANRRRFDEVLAVECRRSLRSGNPLALLMVDVDHFKLFNDRHGHPAGDVCLRSVAELLTHSCPRATDMVARVGGEEFGIILPDTPSEGAAQVARRILHVMRARAISHEDSEPIGIVTVSVGVACHDHPVQDGPRSRSSRDPGIINATEGLVAAADQALYRAKRGGRNRAFFTSPLDEDTGRWAHDPFVDPIDDSVLRESA
jgi:diguanylate cyclase (GGDEF)-like protein